MDNEETKARALRAVSMSVTITYLPMSDDEQAALVRRAVNAWLYSEESCMFDIEHGTV